MNNGWQQPMKSFLSDLGTLRGRIFFWLGLAILPVFWIWWMRPTYFSRRQRIAGWVWTAVYVALLVLFRDSLSHRWEHLMASYPVVAIRLGVALSVWFLVRVFSLGRVIIGFIVCTDMLAMMFSLAARAFNATGLSFTTPMIFIFPLLVALAHLLVEPVRRIFTVPNPEDREQHLTFGE